MLVPRTLPKHVRTVGPDQSPVTQMLLLCRVFLLRPERDRLPRSDYGLPLAIKRKSIAIALNMDGAHSSALAIFLSYFLAFIGLLALVLSSFRGRFGPANKNHGFIFSGLTIAYFAHTWSCESTRVLRAFKILHALTQSYQRLPDAS